MIDRRASAVLVSAILLFAPTVLAGTVNIKTSNYINFPGTTHTQTFTLGTQVFTGSTNCSSGGGAVSTILHVDSVTGHSLSLAAGDSVLLTVDPGTPYPMADQNGLFVSWGFAAGDSGLVTLLPGDGRQICVMGFDGVKQFDARFYAGIQLLDACGNERYNWRPGETVTFKVSGGLTFNPEQHRLLAAGGSVNECTFVPPPPYTTVYVTSDPFLYSFTLPSSDAEIPAGCTSGGTQHITGNWRVVAYDPSCGCNRAQTVFTVADDAPPVGPCTISCPADVAVTAEDDACGAVVEYETPVGSTCTHPSGSLFSVGSTTVTCTAGSLSCDFDVTVTDDEAPTIGHLPFAWPFLLWPAKQQMVNVTLFYKTTDNCGPPSCSVTSVTSNEAVSGLWKGDKSPDWEIVDAKHVKLRAERSEKGKGRIYTITVTCTDASGNAVAKTINVLVPKSHDDDDDHH